MSVWQAIELLDTLVDDSDPDVSHSLALQQLLSCWRIGTDTDTRFVQTSLSQIEHLLQTAEAIRRDGKPEWMQVRSLYFRNGPP